MMVSARCAPWRHSGSFASRPVVAWSARRSGCRCARAAPCACAGTGGCAGCLRRTAARATADGELRHEERRRDRKACEDEHGDDHPVAGVLARALATWGQQVFARRAALGAKEELFLAAETDLAEHRELFDDDERAQQRHAPSMRDRDVARVRLRPADPEPLAVLAEQVADVRRAVREEPAWIGVLRDPPARQPRGLRRS